MATIASELLKLTRAVRNPAQWNYERLEKAGLDLAPTRPDVHHSRVPDTKVMSGKARPADFIRPYYGDALPKELLKAQLYNKATRVLEPDSYRRMFDKVEFRRDPARALSAYYDGNKITPLVNLPNARSEKIDRKNYATMKEWSDPSKPDYTKRDADLIAKETRMNSFENLEARSKDRIGGAAEHEFTHHYARPDKWNGGVMDKLYFDTIYAGEDAGGTDFSDYHTARSSEMTQAAARFQRELFAHTGKRIENPEDFIKLVDSEDNMDFMTPEAKRFLVYARNIRRDPGNPKDSESDRKYNEKARARVVEGMSKVLPATVSRDDTFLNRVDERIRSLPA